MDTKRSPLVSVVLLSTMLLGSAVLGWRLGDRMADGIDAPDPHPPLVLMRR